MINLNDHFPVDGLNNYLVGRSFIRISPLTGGSSKGTVKSISIAFDGDILEGNMFRPIINVTSTNGVTYDYNELLFNINEKLESRAKILLEIQKQEEDRGLSMLGDI